MDFITLSLQDHYSIAWAFLHYILYPLQLLKEPISSLNSLPAYSWAYRCQFWMQPYISNCLNRSVTTVMILLSWAQNPSLLRFTLCYNFTKSTIGWWIPVIKLEYCSILSLLTLWRISRLAILLWTCFWLSAMGEEIFCFI